MVAVTNVVAAFEWLQKKHVVSPSARLFGVIFTSFLPEVCCDFKWGTSDTPWFGYFLCEKPMLYDLWPLQLHPHLVSTIRTVGLWKSTKRSESAFSVLDELNLSHGGYFPDVIGPFSTIFHPHLYANTLRSRIQKVKPFEAFGLCFRYIAARTLHLGLSI